MLTSDVGFNLSCLFMFIAFKSEWQKKCRVTEKMYKVMHY